MKIMVIQGPNLNLLGSREQEFYGTGTLEEIHSGLEALGLELGLEVAAFQSNHEGEIIEAIQTASGEGVSALIINPAAYTHTSVAIRDALLAVGLPYFEVHISNIHSREDFRHRSMISDGAAGIVIGFGAAGYALALRGASIYLGTGTKTGDSGS